MASGPVFMFCAAELVFGGTEGVVSRFHVLRSRSRFPRYRGRRVPFSCFALLDIFFAVPSASGPVFMFCAPGLIFDGIEGDRFCFHVLRTGTSFWRYRGRLVPFSCFALSDKFFAVPNVLGPFSCFARPESFSAEARVSGPVFMSCAPGVVYRGTEGVGSRFQVFGSRTYFWQHRGYQVPFSSFASSDSFSAVPRASVRFSCFALPDMFFAVPSASGPVFMFYAPELIFDGPEGDEFCFHVLRVGTSFLRYRGRRVPYSCFALPDTFLEVRRASGPVFMFCAPKVISRGTEGVMSRFQVLRARTHFRRYRGHPVPFSCFTFPDMFLVVSSASGLVFMFYAP
jgi:hypothetical protein